MEDTHVGGSTARIRLVIWSLYMYIPVENVWKDTLLISLVLNNSHFHRLSRHKSGCKDNVFFFSVPGYQGSVKTKSTERMVKLAQQCMDRTSAIMEVTGKNIGNLIKEEPSTFNTKRRGSP